MNAQTKIEPQSTAIALVVEQTPAIVLTDTSQREAFYAHIEREVEAFEPDTGTEKGRKAIKAFAYKITRTKTAIDDAGKQLNEEARARINAVDAERRVVKERLDALAKQVRKPLTDWETAEDDRIAECVAIISQFKSDMVVTLEDTAESVRERGRAVWNVALDADVFREKMDEAQAAKGLAVSTLKTALARLTKEEADRAELEALRAANAEREEREQAEREAREAEEQRLAEVKAAEDRKVAEEKAAEARRVAAEKAEAERIEQARKDAQAAAQRKAEEAQAERDREHAAQLAAERKAREDAEHAIEVERARLAVEEAHRQAMAKQLAAEQAQRDADQKHRTKIKTAAKEAVMSCGADEETAKKIVVAILANEIPNVTLRF